MATERLGWAHLSLRDNGQLGHMPFGLIDSRRYRTHVVSLSARSVSTRDTSVEFFRPDRSDESGLSGIVFRSA
jgi:hypothetical protein